MAVTYPIRPSVWTQIRVAAISNSQIAISQTLNPGRGGQL